MVLLVALLLLVLLAVPVALVALVDLLILVLLLLLLSHQSHRLSDLVGLVDLVVLRHLLLEALVDLVVPRHLLLEALVDLRRHLSQACLAVLALHHFRLHLLALAALVLQVFLLPRLALPVLLYQVHLHQEDQQGQLHQQDLQGLVGMMDIYLEDLPGQQRLVDQQGQVDQQGLGSRLGHCSKSHQAISSRPHFAGGQSQHRRRGKKLSGRSPCSMDADFFRQLPNGHLRKRPVSKQGIRRSGTQCPSQLLRRSGHGCKAVYFGSRSGRRPVGKWLLVCSQS
jgi:hypothetical protein